MIPAKFIKYDLYYTKKSASRVRRIAIDPVLVLIYNPQSLY